MKMLGSKKTYFWQLKYYYTTKVWVVNFVFEVQAATAPDILIQVWKGDRIRGDKYS